MTKRVKLGNVFDALQALEDPKYNAWRFFKPVYTHPSSMFVGIRVPQSRQVVKEVECSEKDMIELIKSNKHEYRRTGLFYLNEIYKNGDKQRAIDLYLELIEHVNNWDLVDGSVVVPGRWLMENYTPKEGLIKEYNSDKHLELIKELPEWYQKLLKSKDLWEMRISIVLLLSCKEHPDFCFNILNYCSARKEIYLYGKEFNDHDLIHKAIGWLIRDTGKTNKTKMLRFLDLFAMHLHPTTISYSTEHLNPSQKQKYKKMAKK
ncbi:hypothetical protein HK103_002354 [Boothiomyces macroporosus]|uniref:DNA alkylation repair protein n=1 Tax=Boothiomyces macroporosus TaxID=261099 RepID=A0AAD5Y539_9FUNG|nr:hypothetical protein HK103_002354 [Boothiomyces macroporosus]